MLILRRLCLRTALALVLPVAVFAALPPGTALAHANLIQSDPPAQSALARAPSEVRLTFSEPVEPRFLGATVLDRDRKPVDKGDARLLAGSTDTVVLSLADLQPGVYTISWSMVSTVDGHTTRGLVPFSVGEAGAVPGPLSAAEIGAATSGESTIQSGPAGIVARWLTLISMLALGGLAVAMPLLLVPMGRTLAGMRTDRDAAVTQDAPGWVTAAARVRVLRLCTGALGLFFVGSLFLLLVDTAAARDSSLAGAVPEIFAGLVDTRRGLLWLVRSVLGLALAVLLALIRGRPHGEGKGSAPWWAAAALVAGMLLATSLGSHAAALSGMALAVAIDWIHLAASTVWVGGLLFLAFAFFPSMVPLAGPARTKVLASLVPRFSTIALTSVAVIVLTGAIQTWRLLDPFSAFLEIKWGQALAVKLVLVLGLVALGAVNLLLIRPRLADFAERMDKPTRERAAALRLRFRRVVLAESVLAVIIVLVAGVITGVSPSRNEEAGLDGPFRPFVLTTSVEDLTGRLVLAPGQIGNNRFDLTVQAGGGRSLPQETSVALRITTLDQETGTAEVKMEALGGGRFTATGSYLSTVGFWEVAAVVRRALQDDVILPFRLSLTESTGRSQAQEQKAAAPLARGREIYEQNCIQCHGVAGRGDGPLAANLRPPPLNLTEHVPLHSDQEIENWIRNGITRTAMPVFGEQFKPEEVQAIINYLRELARQSGQAR